METQSLKLVRQFNHIRATDGYFKDGIEALAIAIRHIQSNSSADTCYIDLPGAAIVRVEFNGGVPAFYVNLQPTLYACEEVTRTQAVDYLEGAF